MSSVAAYGDGLNHKESDPLAPDYHADPYVRHKATTERLLFRMHQQSGFPGGHIPPLRSSMAPENPFYREAFFWDRLRAGRPILIPGDGHRLIAIRLRERPGGRHAERNGGAEGGGRGFQRGQSAPPSRRRN